MSKIKLGIAAFAAVLAFSVVATSAASAATAGWMVKGTLLSGSKALATTAKITSGSSILEGAGFRVVCKGQNLVGVGPVISSPAMGLATSLEFTECAGEGTCAIEGTTIKTVPILAEATLEGTLAAKATFTPETKNTFTTIKFLGETCALLGIQPVTGSQQVSAPEGQDERTLQLIQAIGETLKVGSTPAKLLGSAQLKLASGETWSFL